MKTFQLLKISFLFVAITTTSSVVGEGSDIVFDGEGDFVKPNVPYYISFMTSDYNLWICRMKWGSTDPNACPQQPLMVTRPNIALPTQVMFVLSNKSDVVVRESANLHIKFVNPPHCGQSGFWRVAQNAKTLEGEVVLNGSESTKDSTFQIHQTNEYYKFTFGDGYDQTSISLSNEYPIYRLLSKKFSGEMEIYFYKNMSTVN